jgi:hypothetical protein
MFVEMCNTDIPQRLTKCHDLGYLCLLAHSCVKHILYCVFVCFSSSMLQVSLDCPFLVALSVFSNVYLEVMT